MTDLSQVTGTILTTTGMVIGIKTMDRVARVGTKRRTKSGRTKVTAYGITYTSAGKRRLYKQQMFKSRSAAIRSSIYKKLKKQHKNPRPKKIVITVKKK